MLRGASRLAWVAFAGALIAVRPAAAEKVEVAGSTLFFTESLSEDILLFKLRFPEESRVTSDWTAALISVAATLEERPADWLGLHLTLDTGLIGIDGSATHFDGKKFEDYAKETAFLGETYADLQLGETGVVLVQAGKLRPSIGGGAIFDAYAFGAMLDADLGLLGDDNPWRFRFHALVPDGTFTSHSKTSPLFNLEVGYALGEETELRLLASVFVDSKNGLRSVLAGSAEKARLVEVRDAIAAREGMPLRRLIAASEARTLLEGYRGGLFGFDVTSQGRLGWLGLRFSHVSDRFTFRALALAGLGTVTAEIRPNETLAAAMQGCPKPLRDAALPFCEIGGALAPRAENLTIRSGFAELAGGVQVLEPLYLGAFVVGVSGDQGFVSSDGKITYGSFLSLAPRLPYTSIFFRGAVSRTPAGTLANPLASDRATATSIAPDAAGLVSAGWNAVVTPWDFLRAEIVGALMSATAGSNTAGQRFFGMEADVLIDVQLHDMISFNLDAGVFVPGSYYGQVPTGYQVIAGFAVIAPGR